MKDGESMRFFILASFAPSLRSFRGALIEALCQRGFEIHVAAPGLMANEQVRTWLERRGVVCHDVSLSRSGLNPLSDFATLWNLTCLMRRIRPDVFLGYTIKPVIWGLIAARISRVHKRVALITGLGYAFTGKAGGLRGIVRRFAQGLYRAALKNASLIFFQNPDDRKEFEGLGLIRPNISVHVVAGSGVDITHFSVEPMPSGQIRFLLIARLLGDKGIREYIEAGRKLRQAWPNVEFHLIGGSDPSPDGISEEEVARWHDAVVWHGHISDVRSAIAQTHVYVLPSYREGTPRTVLEAMSMGRPIITTDAPGCRETVVPDINGILVPIKSVDALEGAMLRFIKDPDLIARMGTQSRRIAEEKFDVHKVNSAMIEAMEL